MLLLCYSEQNKTGRSALGLERAITHQPTPVWSDAAFQLDDIVAVVP